MFWLGDNRGFLIDWLTQQWVRVSGRTVNLREQTWLDGPAGDARRIGREFFARYAASNDLEVVENETCGLITDFDQLNLPAPVAPGVRDFYEHTARYELDAWSEWSGIFRPFGAALALLFSRRLQQLNLPLSPLDSSRGMSSHVFQFRGRHGAAQTVWVRELHATRNTLYAGTYSLCRIPGCEGVCLRVVFPLPHGNAVVVMRPEAHSDGSFSVISEGRGFGEPGFYFVVHRGAGLARARYLASMRESIHVYPGGDGAVRADHVLRFLGFRFLRLHYRMRISNRTKENHASAVLHERQ